MVPSSAPHVLLVGPAHERVLRICNLLSERGLSASRCEADAPGRRAALAAADLVVFAPDPQRPDEGMEELAALLGYARAGNGPAVIWGAPDNFTPPAGLLIDCLDADVPLEEVGDRLAALARYAPLLRRMDQELWQLQRIGRQLNRHFDEIDQELRLAGQLQREFLPRALPSVAPLRFAQLYRPAGWVSGDIYDVFQIDAERIGMFIADAMGHGTAAGLMTMFLRRALVPREIREGVERVLSPAEVMHRLHDSLAAHNLRHSQFVTAAYAVIEVGSLELHLARGGHPYPLHVDAAGNVRELRCDGGLLGVAGLDPEFEEQHVRLLAGDKLVLYTDGLEDTLIRGRDRQTEQAEFTPQLLDWAHLAAEPMVATIDEYLDRQEGSLNPADDVTLLVLEVTG